MEVTSQATINTKTLKKKDGSFPAWLSGTYVFFIMSANIH